jgi:CDP-diacylglycerol--glycerol-3-phosphate 3-phosphatidyltransferase
VSSVPASRLRDSRLVRALGTGPNLITLSRLALLGAALALVAAGRVGTGLVIGATAGVTDYADGWLARRTGQVSRLGEILDQFCDVVLELVLLVTAVAARVLPLAVLIPYVLREVWVTSLRRSSIELGENIPSCRTGKLKAAFIGWSAVPLFAGLFGLAGRWSPTLLMVGRLGIFVGLGLTIISGLQYTASWVRIFERRPEPAGTLMLASYPGAGACDRGCPSANSVGGCGHDSDVCR